MNSKLQTGLALAGAITLALGMAACSQNGPSGGNGAASAPQPATSILPGQGGSAMGAAQSTPTPAAAATANGEAVTYVAELKPMNSKVVGSDTSGQAKVVVNGDNVDISVHVQHAPPDMEHWQHFHGFKDGKAASCPGAKADANGDGIVDLIETEPASGTTMVPFDKDPAAMDVAHGSYPTASDDGSYTYHESVPLDQLQAAFGKAFDGQKLDFGKRVVYIHGVPSDTKLPDSVQSLGPIPAQVTLPIACGEFKRAE